MKRLWLVALLLCIAAESVQSEVGLRHVEQAGGFSLQAPKGWQFREIAGLKYKAAIGPAANAFSPNINIVDEAYVGPLKTYVDENVKTLQRMFENFSLLKRDAFVTQSGVKGERLITTSLQQRIMVRQTFYLFPGVKGRYIVVTCTALSDGGAVLDPVFEESVRTFDVTAR